MPQGTTAGGAGIEWDQTSGLQITNGDQTHVVDIQTAETVEDLLNLLNGSGASVLAEINDQRNGISVRSTLSGADFTIGENGGSTATDLGLRSLTAGTALADLNFGLGVQSVDGTDFYIRRNDGVELAIDTSSADDDRGRAGTDQQPSRTISIRRRPSWPELRAYGNGIELVDDNPAGTDTLQVRRAGISMAAWDLGLIPRGDETSPAAGSARRLTATAIGGLRAAAPAEHGAAHRRSAMRARNGTVSKS